MASNGFRIDVDDADVIRAIQKLGFNTQNVVANFLKAEALKWQKDIRKKITENRSVVSGDLRRSISIQPKTKFEYVVGTNLFYAPYVEYGTRGTGRHGATSPKPYLQPVFNSRADNFKLQLTAILKEALR